MQRKKYNSIDLVKFIMSVCIIEYHTWPYFGMENAIGKGLYYSFFALALPFFFISSGFFLANSLDDDFCSERNFKIVKTGMLRYLKLYLIWTAVYLPITVCHFVDTGTPVVRALLSFIRGVAVLGFNYNSWQMWYLLSTVYALLMIMVCMKYKLDRKYVLIIGVFALVMMLVFDYLRDSLNSQISFIALMAKLTEKTVSSGKMFMGLFYIPVGIYLQRHPLSKRTAWIVFSVSFIVTVFLNTQTLQSVADVPKGIAFFELVRNAELQDSKIYSYCRKLSSINYFLHMFIFTLYYMIVYGEKVQGWDCFAVTLFVTLIIGTVYLEVKNGKKNKKITA